MWCVILVVVGLAATIVEFTLSEEQALSVHDAVDENAGTRSFLGA